MCPPHLKSVKCNYYDRRDKTRKCERAEHVQHNARNSWIKNRIVGPKARSENGKAESQNHCTDSDDECDENHRPEWGSLLSSFAHTANPHTDERAKQNW